MVPIRAHFGVREDPGCEALITDDMAARGKADGATCLSGRGVGRVYVRADEAFAVWWRGDVCLRVLDVSWRVDDLVE